MQPDYKSNTRLRFQVKTTYLAILTLFVFGCSLLHNSKTSSTATQFAGLYLSQPPSSPSTVTQPTILISGTTQGEFVSVFSDTSCSTPVSSPVLSTGGNLQITLNTLLPGSYTFHALSKDSAGVVIKQCSSTTINYVVSSPPIPQLTLFAGNIQGSGNLDGTGSAARFSGPSGSAIDAAGNIFITDTYNNTVRKITPAGVVSTVAGIPGVSGSQDGPALSATFNFPNGLVFDSSGNLFIVESFAHTIRKLSSTGVVSTFAGSSGSGNEVDGTGSAARFLLPYAIAINPAGNLIVADLFGQTIRMVSPGAVVTTIAGVPHLSGNQNGVGSSAKFNSPYGIAVDSAGNVYVADLINNSIRKIDTSLNVTTFAGSNSPGGSGSTDGNGSVALLNSPTSLTFDGSGNLFITDGGNSTIRKITPSADVTTIAGSTGVRGATDGVGVNAKFDTPTGISIDSSGNLMVTDQNNNTIRKIDSSFNVTTFAGAAAILGSADGVAASAQFQRPSGLAPDFAGNLFVVDSNNNNIRKISSTGNVTTIAGSAGVTGSADANGTSATFNSPGDVAVDSSNALYISDSFNNTVRRVSPSGDVTTVAGVAGSSGNSDGAASSAKFHSPAGIAVDSSGALYIADKFNHSIRKIVGGVVSTFAGLSGTSGSSDGALSSARFLNPSGLFLTSSGDLYVADTGNNTIRKISGGTVTTIAGQVGVSGHQDGAANSATFNSPSWLTMAPSGDVFVSDSGNSTIRKINTSGNVSTTAGAYPKVGVTLGNVPGTLSSPQGLAVIGVNLFISTASGIVEMPLP